MRPSHDNQRKHTVLLLLLSVGMFGFAFALVPLYNVFCELTGINGRTGGPVAYTEQASLSLKREVTIQFLAHVSRGMPWEFRPLENRLRVRLGEVNETRYYVRNRASQAVTGQAVPSVSPGLAATHLQKIECFCFTQQRLEPGEALEMPVRFFVDADLPAEIQELSLSYTLFRIPEARTARLTSDRPTAAAEPAPHDAPY